MAENDIYNSKETYERFVDNLNSLTIKPNKENKRKYYCRNKNNLIYFEKLFRLFDRKDTSYIRRLRLLGTMKLIVHLSKKNLENLEREDINTLVADMHKIYDSPRTKRDFIRDIKYIWRNLFPEKDERGRIDETITPYAVRHLSDRQDKSREKRRRDKLTLEEYERILNYFNNDSRMQCYLNLALESLGRPQEMLYIRLRDIEKYDNYAKLWISEHGKEGIGFLQCIDSYPYLIKWLKEHPKPQGDDSFLFINLRGNNFGKQLTPANINKKLKLACKHLSINKPITAYSLKRNGVTFKRIRGDSDIEIQRTARWTSTKQLKIYDLTDQDDALKIQLAKRGLIQEEKFRQYLPETIRCSFCDTVSGFHEEFCTNPSCKRPLAGKGPKEINNDIVRISARIFEQNPALLQKMKVLIEGELKQEKTLA